MITYVLLTRRYFKFLPVHIPLPFSRHTLGQPLASTLRGFTDSDCYNGSSMQMLEPIMVEDDTVKAVLGDPVTLRAILNINPSPPPR